ncbi:MAG: hypothetical protein ACE5GL_01380, partial [Calditrichia bacterium]
MEVKSKKVNGKRRDWDISISGYWVIRLWSKLGYHPYYSRCAALLGNENDRSTASKTNDCTRMG